MELVGIYVTGIFSIGIVIGIIALLCNVVSTIWDTKTVVDAIHHELRCLRQEAEEANKTLDEIEEHLGLDDEKKELEESPK